MPGLGNFAKYCTRHTFIQVIGTAQGLYNPHDQGFLQTRLCFKHGILSPEVQPSRSNFKLLLFMHTIALPLLEIRRLLTEG